MCSTTLSAATRTSSSTGSASRRTDIKPGVSFPAAHPCWTGLLLAAATIPVFILLSEPLARQWGALLLATIGGAYIGFAARDGRSGAKIIELAGALAFGVLGLAGLYFHPLWIAGGYVAHGFWDILHHRHGPYADTPRWYIPFCVVYDWIIGAFLIIWWW
ncbi:MAG TPA: DUF6010 family protein [Woeseiaceae bacterium]|nr:DUF6010 family protein [Woeseiaceae bacterium]